MANKKNDEDVVLVEENEVEKAKHIIEKDRTARAAKAIEILEATLKELNCALNITVTAK